MRKTIKNVTIVVPVLMTNCHVSLKPKTGPVPAQTMITVTATRKATGRPVARAVHLAKRENQDLDFVGRIVVLPCLEDEKPPLIFLCANGGGGQTLALFHTVTSQYASRRDP